MRKNVLTADRKKCVLCEREEGCFEHCIGECMRTAGERVEVRDSSYVRGNVEAIGWTKKLKSQRKERESTNK